MQKNRLAAPCALLAMAGLACSALATNTIETEPNDNKGTANAIGPLVAGSTITGNTTGSSTTTAGPASADNYRVQTAAAPLGIYRHRLVVTTSGTAGHVATIRGLGTTSGVPNTTDATIQTSSTATTPARMIQWYGFGKGEEIIARVNGTDARAVRRRLFRLHRAVRKDRTTQHRANSSGSVATRRADRVNAS